MAASLRRRTSSIARALGLAALAVSARGQLVEGPPSNAYAPGERYPNVYSSLGRSLAGVQLGGEKPRRLIAAGAIRHDQGVVVLLAPRSRRVVREIRGGRAGQSFGASLASHGSILVIGEPEAEDRSGRVRVVDVDRPGEARWLSAFEGSCAFGANLLVVPDTFGNGFSTLIAAPRSLGVEGQRGAVALYREAEGEPVWLQRALSPEIEFGRTLALLDDVDGDGIRDFAVATHRPPRGVVVMLSGRDGARLREWLADADGDGFGSGLAGIEDLDGDGLGDLAIGVPRKPCAEGYAGRVRLVSTATGATIHTLDSDCERRAWVGESLRFGVALLSLHEHSSSAPTLVVGEPGGFIGGAEYGRVSAWELATPARRACFTWAEPGFSPFEFGSTLSTCTLELDEPRTVVLIGGSREALPGGGLHVRALDLGRVIWEIFGCHLEPPD